MTVLAETTVGQVASEHPIATRVFARHQIDFCCGGGRPIADICAAMGLDTAAILQEINVELSTADFDVDQWNEAPLPDLIEHIVGTALERERKVQATVGLYAPNPLGYTRATMVTTMGCNPERGS